MLDRPAVPRWRREPARLAVPDGPRRRRARHARWRRWAAAGLAAAAALVTVGALRPAPAGGTGLPTVVMVRDVAAGQRVGPDDVMLAARPAAERPESALSTVGAVVGRVVAAPLSSREVVTAERLLAEGPLRGQPAGHVAVSVPVLDAASVGVRAGDHVDLYATGTGARAASDVVVLAVHDARESTGLGAGSPARMTLALGPEQAGTVARGLGGLDAGQGLVVAVRQDAGAAQ
jgi:Flp pilus assembly protein CpaB